MSVPIGSRHMATETPARGARGEGWRGWFLNSTERCSSSCVRVSLIFLKYKVWLRGMITKMLVRVKLGLTHHPLPSRVDLLNVADSWCPDILVTAVLFLIF